MSLSYSRASRLASSSPKDFDFQFFVFQNEGDYPMWMSPRQLLGILYSLPESLFWNAIIAVMCIISIIMHSMKYVSLSNLFNIPVSQCVDIGFNLLFILDIVGRILDDKHKAKQLERRVTKWTNIVWYILDILSFVHIIPLKGKIHGVLKLVCYYERLHRPIKFITSLLNYFLMGNVFVAFLKYGYIIFLVTIMKTNFSLWVEKQEDPLYDKVPDTWKYWKEGQLFFRKYYTTFNSFLGFGTNYVVIYDDALRLNLLLDMLMGCLLLKMIAVASLALIIGIYLRPEESFRARFRLIMQDMEEMHVPKLLREKVETFYRMYWLKQKAVSVTYLLPTYPPTLINAIRTDIYFEAQQKSRVLRDLSFQFFSEIAKRMETINYIPGDVIVNRNTIKNTMIYISYGDVEMVTAEDDDTPVLRFTRGTIINPCGACVQVACSRSHVAIRAATFCTAHVLKTIDLWRVTMKYGKINGQSFILRSSFEEHFERVKHHYANRESPVFKHKSNIMVLKHNLMELKQSEDPVTGRRMLSRADIFLEIAGCYNMRNRNDTKLTEEADAICLHPTFPCILQPSSSLLIAWETFIALLALVIAIVYPYYMVYIGDVSISFRFYDYMISLIFIVDIITHLSTGVKIEEGVPITFWHTSARQVSSIWFGIDILSVAPILELVGDGYYAGMNKLLKLFKVFRVLKHYENVWVNQANALRFFSYFLFFVLLVYLLASVHQAHMCTSHNYCEVKNISKVPFWTKDKLDPENLLIRIFMGIYWAISIITFCAHKTAYLSLNNWQMSAFSLAFMDVCSKLNILLKAVFTATIMVTESMSVDYDACIRTVKDFMIKNNVDPVLRHRFITYLELCWYTDKAYSINHGKNSILYDLPPHVFQDIMAMQRNSYLLCIPFMKFLNKEMLKKVSSNARLFYTSPNEILLNTGDISNEVYVIRQGYCEVLSPDTKEVVALITSKSFFGIMECILRIPAFYTVRAVTHVQVLSISRKYLARAIRVPKIRDAILFAKQQPEYSRLTKRREQFLTYKLPPPAPNREFFPLPRKHEPDTAFLFPFNRLGFLALLRYVFPRYTIRPDGRYLRRYEWFRAACAFTSANIFPLYSTLVMQWPWLSYFCWFLDITAYVDIIQRMLVGYFDKKGILVYHPASTAAHYMTGAFFLDLAGCFPLETLNNLQEFIYPHQHWFLYPKWLQYYMFNRMLQIYRLPNALNAFHEVIDRKDIVFLIKMFPLFLALLVVVTSVIIEGSVHKFTSTTAPYYFKKQYDPIYSNWIREGVVNYNITGSGWSLVLTTFFWSTYEITFVGYPVFHCSRQRLLIYVIVGMLIGMVMTTYFAVRVISIRANLNQSLVSFKENLKDLMVYMKKEKLDKDLQREMLSYYEYTWEKTGGTNYRSVLKMCDQITLRTDTILHIYGHTFAKCPIMYRCEQSLLRVVGRAVHSMYYQDTMMIAARKEVLKDMYFIDYGSLEVFDEEERVITKLPRGSVFGNLDNASSVLSPNRFVAIASSHILKINSQIFYKIIQDFPTVRLLIKKHRPNDESYIIGGSSGKVMTTWKERVQSSPKIVVTRQGFLKFFHTHNLMLQIYMIIISLLCVFVDIYNAGFLNNSTILIVSVYLLDLAFITKIILNYVLPFMTDDESETRVVLLSTRKSYIDGEFKYDIISCLPLEIFCFVSQRKLTAFAFLRLNRLFRLVTVHHSMKSLHLRLSTNLSVSTGISMSIWFSFFVHCATCTWYSIGYMEETKEYKSSWFYKDKSIPWCKNRYFCSLYFVLCTLTQNAVGDILPKQKSEVVFVCFLMIASTMMIMIYVGEFANIIQYRLYRCFAFFSKVLQLQEFLNNNRVANNMRELTKKYTLHLWRESRGLQMPHFLLAAPQAFKQKIMSAAYMHHLIAHPDFKDCDPEFLRHLCGCFKHYYYSEDMFVVREGEITNSMYFIHKGRVQEIAEDIEVKMLEYNAVEHFGSGLHRDTPFTISYKTVIKSQILTLSLNDWQSVLVHFPQSKSNIYMVKPDHVYKSAPPKIEFKQKKSVKVAAKATKYRMFKSITSSALNKSAKLERAAAKLEANKSAGTQSDPVDEHIPFKQAHTVWEPKPLTATASSQVEPAISPFLDIPLGRSSASTLVPEPMSNKDSEKKSTQVQVDTEKKPEDDDDDDYKPPKITYGRRKSTVHGIDKAAVDAELKTLGSDISIQKPDPLSLAPEFKISQPVPESSPSKPEPPKTEPLMPVPLFLTKPEPTLSEAQRSSPERASAFAETELSLPEPESAFPDSELLPSVPESTSPNVKPPLLAPLSVTKPEPTLSEAEQPSPESVSAFTGTELYSTLPEPMVAQPELLKPDPALLIHEPSLTEPENVSPVSESTLPKQDHPELLSTSVPAQPEPESSSPERLSRSLEPVSQEPGRTTPKLESALTETELSLPLPISSAMEPAIPQQAPELIDLELATLPPKLEPKAELLEPGLKTSITAPVSESQIPELQLTEAEPASILHKTDSQVEQAPESVLLAPELALLAPESAKPEQEQVLSELQSSLPEHNPLTIKTESYTSLPKTEGLSPESVISKVDLTEPKVTLTEPEPSLLPDRASEPTLSKPENALQEGKLESQATETSSLTTKPQSVATESVLPAPVSATLVSESGLPKSEPPLPVPESNLETPEPALQAPEPVSLAPEPVLPAPVSATFVSESGEPKSEPPLPVPESNLVTPEPALPAPEPASLAPEPASLVPDPILPAPVSATLVSESGLLKSEPPLPVPESNLVTPEPALPAPEPASLAPEPASLVPEPILPAPLSATLVSESGLPKSEPPLPVPESNLVTPEPALPAPEPASLATERELLEPEPSLPIVELKLPVPEHIVPQSASPAHEHALPKEELPTATELVETVEQVLDSVLASEPEMLKPESGAVLEPKDASLLPESAFSESKGAASVPESVPISESLTEPKSKFAKSEPGLMEGIKEPGSEPKPESESALPEEELTLPAVPEPETMATNFRQFSHPMLTSEPITPKPDVTAVEPESVISKSELTTELAEGKSLTAPKPELLESAVMETKPPSLMPEPEPTELTQPIEPAQPTESKLDSVEPKLEQSPPKTDTPTSKVELALMMSDSGFRTSKLSILESDQEMALQESMLLAPEGAELKEEPFTGSLSELPVPKSEAPVHVSEIPKPDTTLPKPEHKIPEPESLLPESEIPLPLTKPEPTLPEPQRSSPLHEDALTETKLSLPETEPASLTPKQILSEPKQGPPTLESVSPKPESTLLQPPPPVSADGDENEITEFKRLTEDDSSLKLTREKSEAESTANIIIPLQRSILNPDEGSTVSLKSVVLPRHTVDAIALSTVAAEQSAASIKSAKESVTLREGTTPSTAPKEENTIVVPKSTKEENAPAPISKTKLNVKSSPSEAKTQMENLNKSSTPISKEHLILHQKPSTSAHKLEFGSKPSRSMKVMENLSDSEDDLLPPVASVSKRKSVAQKLIDLVDAPAGNDEKDNFMVEKDEATTTMLLNTMKERRKSAFQQSTTSHFSKQSRVALHEQPVKRLNLSDANLQDPKEKRSVLGFKDTVTTYKVPKDERDSVSEPNTADKLNEGLKSIQAFAGDIALKEHKLVQAISSASIKSEENVTDQKSKHSHVRYD